MSIRLVVGLGNPEPRYEMTRHNAGFRMVNALAIKYGAELSAAQRMQGEVGRAKIAGYDTILLRPLTYMNLSGRSVSAVVNFYKIDLSNLLVVHDEVALPLGVIRFSRGGSSAGNHGIESIIASIGCKDFHRLRIGVGPDPGGADRARFVLAPVDAGDIDLYDRAIAMSVEASEVWLSDGLQKAMNLYNGRDLREPGAIT